MGNSVNADAILFPFIGLCDTLLCTPKKSIKLATISKHTYIKHINAVVKNP